MGKYTYFLAIPLLLVLPVLSIRDLEEIQKFYDARTHTVRLFGSFDLGYYYVNLFVGSPPQKQTVIVDTGSSITAFPCSDCQAGGCGNHIDPHFDTSKSRTFRPVDCTSYLGQFQCRSCDNQNKRCSFGISYQEGSSLNGYLASDYTALGDEIQNYYENRNHNVEENEQLKDFIGKEKVNFTFGCTTRETNLFYTQRADGILGLGINANTSLIMPNLIDFTFQQHQEINESLAFSLCFGYEGGFMTVGGYNADKHVPNATTSVVSYSTRSGQYTINIHKAKIGDQELSLTYDDFNYEQGSFLDSGTTMFYAHGKVHSAIMNGFNSYCNRDSQNRCPSRTGNCFRYYGSQEGLKDFFSKFPEIAFQLDNDFVFLWDPADYLYKDGSSYCLPFNELPGRVILGGIFMRHYDVLFDRGSKRVHFTRSNCSDEYQGPDFSQKVEFSKDIPQSNSPLKDVSSPSTHSNRVILVLVLAFVGAAIIIGLLVWCYVRRRRSMKTILYNEQEMVDQKEPKISDDISL